jgi:phosphoribosylanthranilate isomerase
MSERVRVKFCGLTRVEDVRFATALGVDAIGLVFAPASPRHVDIATAAELARAAGPFVARVGLFMDPTEAEVRHVLDGVEIDLLQFHGSESAAFCTGFGRRYLKAVPMGGGADPRDVTARHPAAAGFLLDGHRAGEPGGSGRAFDWQRIDAGVKAPLILAGGLDAGNVAHAIALARPYGVDVSSGIEASPGTKDHAKMHAFIDEVRRGGSS